MWGNWKTHRTVNPTPQGTVGSKPTIPAKLEVGIMTSTMTEYAVKRNKMLEYLGGKCSSCSSEENLQIDHVDHLTKSFCVSKSWAFSWEKLKPELDKCQILCKDCHLLKSVSEGSLAKGWTNKERLVHGSLWTYKKHKCRCILCVEGKAIYDASRRKAS